MMESVERLMEAVVRAIRGSRYNYTHEAELQLGLARVLETAAIPFDREADLGEHGRIDFLTEGGVGIEAKIHGSPSDVARQLVGYAESGRVAALILVTGRAALGRLPGALLGKPLIVVPLWEGFL